MKTEKILTAILTMIMACAVLASCGSNPAPSSSPPSDSAPASGNASENAGGGAGGYENDPMYIAAKYLVENAEAAFMGVTDSGDDIVFIETADMAAFLIANGEFQNVSFVGEYEANDAGYAIYDGVSGLVLTFEIIELYEDGSIVCDVGDIGQFALSPTDVETAVFAMLLIAGLTDAVL